MITWILEGLLEQSRGIFLKKDPCGNSLKIKSPHFIITTSQKWSAGVEHTKQVHLESSYSWQVIDHVRVKIGP